MGLSPKCAQNMSRGCSQGNPSGPFSFFFRFFRFRFSTLVCEEDDGGDDAKGGGGDDDKDDNDVNSLEMPVLSPEYIYIT